MIPEEWNFNTVFRTIWALLQHDDCSRAVGQSGSRQSGSRAVGLVSAKVWVLLLSAKPAPYLRTQEFNKLETTHHNDYPQNDSTANQELDIIVTNIFVCHSRRKHLWLYIRCCYFLPLFPFSAWTFLYTPTDDILIGKCDLGFVQVCLCCSLSNPAI